MEPSRLLEFKRESWESKEIKKARVWGISILERKELRKSV